MTAVIGDHSHWVIQVHCAEPLQTPIEQRIVLQGQCARKAWSPTTTGTCPPPPLPHHLLAVKAVPDRHYLRVFHPLRDSSRQKSAIGPLVEKLSGSSLCPPGMPHVTPKWLRTARRPFTSPLICFFYLPWKLENSACTRTALVDDWLTA